MIEPSSVEEIQACVRDQARLVVCGRRTKAALSRGEGARLSLSGLSGIREYEPSEFTFTAWAGTPLRTIADALGEHRQYLPFDPPFINQGGTIGGTVGAGLSGPGRLRYGGARDFILGVEFVSGEGKRIRAGGKVVKNAAGFDLPKLMVGSLGRLGVVTEVCFKVFPRPPARCSAMVQYQTLDDALTKVTALAGSRLELDALEWLPANRQLVFRLAGAPAFLDGRPWEALPEIGTAVQTLEPEAAEQFWTTYTSFGWMEPDSCLVKVPLTPSRIPDLEASLEGMDLLRCYSVAGNVAYIGCADLQPLDGVLRKQGLSGLAIIGDGAEDPWLGVRRASRIAFDVKQAMDPNGRFPPLVGEDEARD